MGYFELLKHTTKGDGLRMDKLRRIKLIGVILVGMIMLKNTPVMASNIKLNGKGIAYMSNVYEEDGVTMVPLRTIADKLRFNTVYYDKEGRISIGSSNDSA